MSVFRDEVITCPGCGVPEVRTVAHSVNGERSPHLREAILAGEFQQVACSACKVEFEIGDPFVYIDRSRRQWIGVFSRGDVDAWRTLERDAVEAWRLAGGPGAPVEAREMLANARVRTVFGLLALREKLLCDVLRVDEVVLELMKIQISVTRGFPGVTSRTEMRLLAADDVDLHLLVGEPGDAESMQFVRVPRDHYAAVASDPRWASLTAQLGEGSFVDARRILVDGDHAPV